MRSFRSLLLSAAIWLRAAGGAAAQHEHAVVVAAGDGSGALAVEYPFDETVVRVSEVACLGGMCLYSSISPSLVSEPQDGGSVGDGLHLLRDGTALSLEIVAIDPAVSVKFDDRVLRTPGTHALLGTAPGLHAHPVWQVTAPEGVVSEYPLSIRVTTTSPLYEDSPAYTIRFSNGSPKTVSPTPTGTPTAGATATATVPGPAATSTATPSLLPTTVGSASETATRRATPTSTATRTATQPSDPTPTSEVPVGDPNCDGRIGAADLIAVVAGIGAGAGACSPDANGDQAIDSCDLGWVLAALVQRPQPSCPNI